MTSPGDGTHPEWEVLDDLGAFSLDDAPEEVAAGFAKGDEPKPDAEAPEEPPQQPQAKSEPAPPGVVVDAPVAPTSAASLDAVAIGAVRHILVFVAALLVWGWSLGQVDESALGDYGLVGILPVAGLAAIGLLIVGFTVAVSNDPSGRIPGLYVVGIAVAIHGMPTFAYDQLRFSWAWKHVGVVEFIARTGEVDRAAESLAVYHNWPGFFGLNAWITTSSQLDSALSYAAWAPIVFNLLYLVALYVLLRALSDDARVVWTAMLFFVIANWVGQDYFAPQALAFFFYLATLALVLRWFRIDADGAPRGPTATGPSTSTHPTPTHRLFVVTITVALLAIAVTHQLTPVMMIVALGALIAFRTIGVRWPLYASAFILAAWVIGPAWEFVVENAGTVLRDIGGFQANLESGITDVDTVNTPQANVAIAARTLTAGLIGLAALGWITRRLVKLPTVPAVALAVAPIALILFSSYGDEFVFRAFLFSLPFLAWLAASVWFPSLDAETPLGAVIALGVVALTMAGAMLVANYGADERNVFSAGEVSVSADVHEAAVPGSLLVDLSRDYPGQFTHYEKFTYVTVDRTSRATQDLVLSDPASVLAEWLADPRFADGYVLITDTMQTSSERLGTMPTGAVPFIEASLRSSDSFVVAFESGDAVAFTLRETP